MGMKTLLTAAVLAVGTIAAAAPASAGFLTGSAVLNGSAKTDTGNINATQILIQPLASPNQAYNIVSFGGEGDLGTLVGSLNLGNMDDIDLTLHWADADFYSINVGSTTLHFNLDDLVVINRDPGTQTISITAKGTLHVDDGSFDDTPALFTASTNAAGTSVFAFSSTTASAVPEPASIALLGAGLAGLGLRRKKRAA